MIAAAALSLSLSLALSLFLSLSLSAKHRTDPDIIKEITSFGSVYSD
jgi:hypothetical protein